MRTARVVAGSLLFALAASGAAAAAAQQPQMMRPRQQQLEAQVLDRFVGAAARNLGLDGAREARLRQVVQTTATRRRDLARASFAVRRDLAAALQSPGTTDEEFSRLLDRVDDVRRRELRIWIDENAELRSLLSPRQRAAFLAMRARFNDRVMRLRQGRPPRP